MRVKFLGAAILALCFFIVGSSSFAETISKEEATRLQSFFMNRFGATIPPESEVIVEGFEASSLEGFKEGVFTVATDRGDQELPFLIGDDGKYILIGKPTDTASFKPSGVEGLREGKIAYGTNQVPILISEDGQTLMIGAQLSSIKDFEDSGFAGFKKGVIQAGRNQVPIFIKGEAEYVIMGSDTISTKDFQDTGIAGLKKGLISGQVPLFVSSDGKTMVLGTQGLGTDIIDTTVDPHKETMEKISLENTPSKGAENGQIAVVEYSDFQCPFCKRGKDMLPEILEEYGDQVTIYYKQLPLPNHDWAMKASIASLCAAEQGNDKFWEFHDKIFDNQKEIDLATADETFKSYAKDLGLNTKEFDQCLGSKEIAARVQADLKEAQEIGVNSTPTFVVNGMKVPGANPQGVKSAINLKLSEGS